MCPYFAREEMFYSLVLKFRFKCARGSFNFRQGGGGDELLTAVAATGFSDDDDIPVWQKRYVATALMDGVISGTEADGDTVFSSGDSITVQEAAVMLNNVLGTTDVPTAAFDGLVPAWASQATANLTACGVLTFSSRYTDTLTRADAAEMLCAAIEVRDSRE